MWSWWSKVEDSGEWSVFKKGLRNPLAAKPSYPKPSKPFYPAYGAALYPQTMVLSNPYSPKTPIKMPRKCNKKL
jgi:hypothetical protein